MFTMVIFFFLCILFNKTKYLEFPEMMESKSAVDFKKKLYIPFFNIRVI